MRSILLLGVGVCVSCARPAVAPVGDAGLVVAVAASEDAGFSLTVERLDAWLAWQRALTQAPKSDGGTDARTRAHLEAALLADAGLTRAEVDFIEDRVAPFIAERNLQRLTGAAAVAQFKSALDSLSPEQKKKAEEAYAAATTRAVVDPLPALEARFGVDAVRAMLTRESELTKRWDELLDLKGETR